MHDRTSWRPVHSGDLESGFVFDGLLSRDTDEPVVVNRVRKRNRRWMSLYDRVVQLACEIGCDIELVRQRRRETPFDDRVAELDEFVAELFTYGTEDEAVLARCEELAALVAALDDAEELVRSGSDKTDLPPPVAVPIALHTDLSPPHALSYMYAGRLIAA